MILMVDKQAKFLSERLGRGNEAQKANTIKEIELASHVSLMSYLKQTFHQRNREFVSSKKVAKQFVPSHQQHQFILTMRTQYEARPHS